MRRSGSVRGATRWCRVFRAVAARRRARRRRHCGRVHRGTTAAVARRKAAAARCADSARWLAGALSRPPSRRWPDRPDVGARRCRPSSRPRPAVAACAKPTARPAVSARPRQRSRRDGRPVRYRAAHARGQPAVFPTRFRGEHTLAVRVRRHLLPAERDGRACRWPSVAGHRAAHTPSAPCNQGAVHATACARFRHRGPACPRPPHRRSDACRRWNGHRR